MKRISLESTMEVYASVDELSPQDANLLKRAKEAVSDAYAPYSNFRVGAALRLKNDKIFIGNNQENAAYPICLCAERVALFAAASVYPKEPVVSLAVTASSASKLLTDPVTPCGSCRQSISETEFRFKTPIRLIMQGETGEIYIMNSIKGLLPLTFNAEFL